MKKALLSIALASTLSLAAVASFAAPAVLNDALGVNSGAPALGVVNDAAAPALGVVNDAAAALGVVNDAAAAPATLG